MYPLKVLNYDVNILTYKSINLELCSFHGNVTNCGSLHYHYGYDNWHDEFFLNSYMIFLLTEIYRDMI